MKTSLFTLGCFYLVICSYVQAINWDKCGSGKQILQLWKLVITPDPIPLSGKDVSVSLQADIYEDIPYGAQVQIRIWKVIMGFIYVKGPCFLPTGCNVELCSFLQYYSGQSVCPVTKGLYQSDNIEFNIPDMGSFIKWFASGSFWIEMKITGTKSEQLTCWSFKGEASMLFSQWNPDILSMYVKNDTAVNYSYNLSN